MPFCTVNRAKYEIPSTSNEGNTNIILEEKYDFPKEIIDFPIYKKGCWFVCQIAVLVCKRARNDHLLQGNNYLNVLKTKTDNVK